MQRLVMTSRLDLHQTLSTISFQNVHCRVVEEHKCYQGLCHATYKAVDSSAQWLQGEFPRVEKACHRFIFQTDLVSSCQNVECRQLKAKGDGWLWREICRRSCVPDHITQSRGRVRDAFSLSGLCCGRGAWGAQRCVCRTRGSQRVRTRRGPHTSYAASRGADAWVCVVCEVTG